MHRYHSQTLNSVKNKLKLIQLELLHKYTKIEVYQTEGEKREEGWNEYASFKRLLETGLISGLTAKTLTTNNKVAKMKQKTNGPAKSASSIIFESIDFRGLSTVKDFCKI